MDFSKYAQKGNEFLGEVSKELGDDYTLNAAGRIVRSFFRVLRDIISIEESLQLISQLPMALKSVYVDGWNNHQPKERIRHMDDFITAVVKEDRPAGYSDFSVKKEGVHAIEAVFRVLKRHVSKGEMEDIRSVLPKDLRVLCDVIQL